MRNIVLALLGARLHLSATNSAIVLTHRGPGPRARTTRLADIKVTEDLMREPRRLLSLCQPLLAQKKNAHLPLHVTVDDSWSRLFLVTPPQNAARLQDLQAAATMRFHALFGDAPGNWQITGDWQASNTFVSCALPKALLQALEQVAKECSLSLQTVQPHFVTAWNQHHRALRHDGWLGVIQEQQLTLAALGTAPGSKRRALQALRTLTFPAGSHDLTWLKDSIARIALQSDLTLPSTLYLVASDGKQWTGTSKDGVLAIKTLGETKTVPHLHAAASKIQDTVAS